MSRTEPRLVEGFGLLVEIILVAATDGLQRVLEATLGEHYRVRVREGAEVTVRLWRR